jgi:ubiquitin-conjugating enzyme (huntingtin interacting protein 2)
MSLRDTRISEEFSKLKKLYQDGVILQLKGFGQQKSMDHLAISFVGPKGTPYEGGIFRLEIKFPADYPNTPPFVRLHTGIWHPNFWPSPKEYPNKRNICLALVDPTLIGTKGGWSPSKTIITVIQAIFAMLNVGGQYINPSDVFNKKAASELMKDRKKFEDKVRYLTRQYATSKW